MIGIASPTVVTEPPVPGGSNRLAGPAGEAGASTEGPPVTPTTWRLFAATLLTGAFAIGIALAAGDGGQWLVAVFAIILGGGLAPILIGSRRPPVGPASVVPSSGPLPSVLVLVAARDEARVIPRLIADLGAQDHRRADGSPLFRVVVIDDRSNDGTGEAVRAAARIHGLGDAVRVLRREGPDLVDGKGAALALAGAEASDADVVAVLDADARIGPGYLRRAAAYVAAGVPALTARRRILHADRSILAKIQADEQTQDGELQRGRWASGGCSEFRGNGMVIRRELLADVGGFPVASLTEDLDLSTLLAARHGITVAWALDLEAWEEAVPVWRGLWRQRLRWSEGGLRRVLAHGPSVLRSTRLAIRGRWDFIAYALQLAAPPLILGALAGAVAQGDPWLVGGLVGSYLVAAGILGFDSLRWETSEHGEHLRIGERLLRSIRVSLFSVIWVATISGAMWRIATRRGPIRFDKTARASGTSGAQVDQPNLSGSPER